MSYCEFVANIEDENNVHRQYHDNQYGFPILDDNALFGRLILEINQAGLSWQTILNKQDAFQAAYQNYHIASIAAFDDDDVARLLGDKGIIRNRLKIHAAIFNAQQLLLIQEQYGSFKNWLDGLHPLPLEDWLVIFKKHFKFVGHQITNEFLMSCGYLAGAHDENCPCYQTVLQHNPAWAVTQS